MLYYRLKDDYILRGWDKLPYAIVNVRTKEPLFLTAKRMQAVKLCDGNIDMSESFISDKVKNIIAEIKDKGFCELFYGGWIKRIADTVKRARPTAECPIKDSSLLV